MSDRHRLARMAGVRAAVLDADGIVLDAWGCWEAPSDLLGHPFIDLLDTEDEPAFREAAARAGRDEGFTANVRSGPRVYWRVDRGVEEDTLLVCGRSGATEVELRDKLARLEATLWKGLPYQNLGYATAGIVHDFNNLLTPVVVSAYELDVGIPHGDPLRVPVDTLVESIEKASALTRHLVSSHFTADGDPGTHVAEALTGMQPLLRQAIEPTHLLALELPEESPTAAISVDRLFQVVMNLVLNARQAMPGGGVICITLDISDNGGRWARLQVADDGVGMDSATMARIFAPRSSVRRSGAGLGLPLVRDIIAKAGGRLVFHSPERRGTVVEVLLPLVEEPAMESTPVPKPESGRGDETILVVDDNRGIRRIAQRTLRRAGYFTMLAGSGDEALMHAIGFPGSIDLVLLDVGLPDRLSGELAADILVRHPEAAVLYMSGYPRDAVPPGAFHQAGVPFLAKPFRSPELLASLRTALLMRGCNRHSPSPPFRAGDPP